MHGRSLLLGYQEGHRSSLPPEAKLGGLIIAGLLAAQAAVAEAKEAELKSAEAELEKAKASARASILGAHGSPVGNGRRLSLRLGNYNSRVGQVSLLGEVCPKYNEFHRVYMISAVFA